MRLQEGKTIKLDEILKSVNSRAHQDVNMTENNATVYQFEFKKTNSSY